MKGGRPFEPGHPKYGGRKAGTPNKVTTEQRNRIKEFFQHHWDEFEKDVWPLLSAKDKKDTFVALLNYQYPKLSSVDMHAAVSKDEEALNILREVVQDPDVI